MGSFIFKWEHPAEEVFVTGTFDNWSKSEKLVKTGQVFKKDVQLANAREKIYYKFVVDGNWVTDHTAPQENDASGNLNNVLTIDRIVKHTPATAGIMSGVAPTSTTSELAKDVPLEKEKSPLEEHGSSDLPGAFPETPAAVERGDFSIDPLPAADGAVNPIKLAPGEKVPNTNSFTTNSITSGVHDDPELVATYKAKSESEPTFGISPLPAFAGAVNPIKVAPGEKIPKSSDLTTNTIHSAVRTDKESYDNSGALGNAPILPPVVTPQAERDFKGTGILDLPPVTKSLIPESSLPMGEGGAGTFDVNPTIQSAGPQSTTSILAAKIPLESTKVPEVVKESQREAGFAPEASAVLSEVSDKSAVEKELKREIDVAPTTSEGVAGQGTIKTEKKVTAGEAAAAVGAAAIAVGGAAYAAAATIPSRLPESVSSIPSNLPESLTSKLPESVQQSINSLSAKGTVDQITEKDIPESLTSKFPESVQQPINSFATTGTVDQTTAKDTPEIVRESIAGSGQSPEAATNETAVLDKKAVEEELLSGHKSETCTAKDTPAVVKESIAESGQSPEAAANEAAVLDKKAVEEELLSGHKSETCTAKDTPAVVKKSIAESGQSPEAAAIEAAVLDKKAVEKELLSEIKPETSTGEPAPIIASANVNDIEPVKSATPTAPVVTSGVASVEVPSISAAAAPAVTSGVESTNIPTFSGPTPPTDTYPIDSRDVSPHTTLATDNRTAPVVTSGLGSTTTAEKSNAAPATPAKENAAVSPAKLSAESATPSSSQVADSPANSAAADKKKKRTSFFGKLKAKFHKD
ncbi:carbohydrate-Binding Module family 48 protein [Sclerotinia borealis F-4128]|uniref:Carbohydrate-Binding Module family 48 protein n=1 Tax=Sclerotinia borealis (strain F-4128) TaxID=1432307 RepID=W9CND8_SCLBF|nr:carbohydrate-Binding Module family 48 protein [Sclerotinia borealis F-4128]